MYKRQTPVSSLVGEIKRYPQVLINVPGPYAAQDKADLIASDTVQDAIRQEEKMLGDSGRILVRPSGTEALLRVMVEAKEESAAQEVAQRLAAVIENAQK